MCSGRFVPGCVQLISIPGTWESSRALDPLNPTPSFPIALLLNVSNPLGQQFGADRLAQYTVPYTAQFHNPLAADNQMSYNDSREEGKKKVILFNMSGHGLLDLASYDAYMAGHLKDI